MAYTRPCNKCGQRISLREMPHGQWVAFDVSTEESHVCGVEHEPDVAVKLKGKNKSRTKEDEDDEEIVLKRHGKNVSHEDEEYNKEIKKKLEEVKNSTIPLKKKEETYDSVSGIHHCINEAIKEKKRIFIKYYSEWKFEHSSRELSPITKFKRKDRVYLQAYCHKEKAPRVFLTKSIEEATLLNKKSFKPKKIPKPDIDKFLNKVEEKKEENEVKEKKTNDSPVEKRKIDIVDEVKGLFELLISIGIVGGLIYLFFVIL